jgi:hypothetical protein
MKNTEEKKTFKTNIRKEIIFLNFKNRKRVKKPQKSSCFAKYRKKENKSIKKKQN